MATLVMAKRRLLNLFTLMIGTAQLWVFGGCDVSIEADVDVDVTYEPGGSQYPDDPFDEVIEACGDERWIHTLEGTALASEGRRRDATGAILDCEDAPMVWRTEPGDEARLWVAGIFEAEDYDLYENRNEAHIVWSKPGHNVLVLSAYRAVTWNLELVADGKLDAVWILGYYDQEVITSATIDIEVYTASAEDCTFACGYQRAEDEHGCGAETLVAMAESLTGLIVTGFDGCYRASKFAFRDRADEASCASAASFER